MASPPVPRREALALFAAAPLALQPSSADAVLPWVFRAILGQAVRRGAVRGAARGLRRRSVPRTTRPRAPSRSAPSSSRGAVTTQRGSGLGAMVSVADLGLLVGDLLAISPAAAATLQANPEIESVIVLDENSNLMIEGVNRSDTTVRGVLKAEILDDETGHMATWGVSPFFVSPANSPFRWGPEPLPDLRRLGVEPGVKSVNLYVDGAFALLVRERVLVLRPEDVRRTAS